MSNNKNGAKRLLRAIGLYKIAQRLYNSRANLRVMCWNAGFRLGGANDGLPIPSSRYIHLTTSKRVICSFLHGGLLTHESILFALRKNDCCVHDFQSVLDFGCGCGRVMRHWKFLNGPNLYGCDYNPELIAWCQRNLDGIAEFKSNNLTPPLDYEDGKFDFIYVISVLTHLTEELQQSWMEELSRVLKPNGLLLITVHGESRLHQLSPAEQEEFLSGQLVVRKGVYAGSNVCGAYHPREYVYNVLARAYDVVDFIEVGSRASDQDLYLLRKPVKIK